MAPEISKCPIWGSGFEAKGFHSPQTDVIRVDESPRAGGEYEIDWFLVLTQVRVLSDEEKARLTTWLVDQRLQGNQQPTVTEEIVMHAKNNRPLRAHERAERLLRFIANSAKSVVGGVEITEESNSFHCARAWSESTNWYEIAYFIDYLKEKGWIRNALTTLDGFIGIGVSVDGYSRIAEAETNVDYAQAFVAMWFDPQMDDACDNGIMPAIEDAGYKPLRIDRKADVNKIDDEIIAGIRRSRFIVADFTQGGDGARGGVYFEAGFALGLGLRVIYTCRSDMVEKLAFDTRQYSHILWDTPEDLRVQLRNRIEAWIGKGPENP